MLPASDPDALKRDIALLGGIEAVPKILDVICRITGMGFAAVARVTEDRWIACTVADHIQFGLQPGGELKIETTICNEIRQSKEPVIIDAVNTDERFRHHHTPLMYGFQSYISMPIVLKNGEFLGTLCAIDPKPARLDTPEIRDMFSLFADMIAFHYEAASNLADSNTNLLAAREASLLREQFIGVLGHDLRNPLGAIRMGAELLSCTPLDEEQKSAVGVIQRGVTRMSELIEDAMDFTRGRLGGGIELQDVTDISPEPVLNQVIEEVRNAWPDRQVITHFDLKEKVRYDRRRLAQLFSNLLTNAMVHGEKTRPIDVRAIAQGGKFELSVGNGAPPIPSETLEKLFEPFLRNNVRNSAQGLGLGLYIASQIAKSHKGRLTASSTEAETRFTFIMESDGSGESGK